MPQERGFPEQSEAGAVWPATLEANTERFFFNLLDPQWGHFAPFQLLERTSNSLSFLQDSQ
jgi:hypothetical protein